MGVIPFFHEGDFLAIEGEGMSFEQVDHVLEFVLVQVFFPFSSAFLFRQ